ncbi:hypothetical protein IODZLFCR_CDS0026 [Salmonella phage vB_SalP_SE29]|uniref:Uncharacterized protein n=2 Tax=Molineuxvirinae TaxID=2731650 RepID=A0A977XQ95_9CAUD|nr:hypothetical protein [Salmonella phage PST_H2]
MIKSQKYFFTKDRKVGFEITVWTKGCITILYECKGFAGLMIRRYRTFTKQECLHLKEEAFLASIIYDIKHIRPYAVQVLIPESLLR